MAKADKEMVRLRFRRTVTLGDAVHQANSLATVEATDEAWALVNRGEADMEPGPGVNGQPFPPEELTTAPAPPAAPLHGTPPAAAPVATAAGPAGTHKGKAAAAKEEDAGTATHAHKAAGHAAHGTHGHAADKDKGK